MARMHRPLHHILLPDALRFQLWRLRDSFADLVRGTAHRREIFRRIHDENLWGDADSVSGGGSSAVATRAVRAELPILFERYGIRSVLDAPCGDFYWMKDVVHILDRYVGVDIVQHLIERNTANYATESISFLCADISADPLPRADLILCRDCFIHLPTRVIRSALRNFRATGARYLLLTHNDHAGPYRDIPVGSFRPISFTNPPFSFPAPIDALAEDDTGDRLLALWELPSLPAEWVGSGP